MLVCPCSAFGGIEMIAQAFVVTIVDGIQQRCGLKIFERLVAESVQKRRVCIDEEPLVNYRDWVKRLFEP
jgi:hypothetical protein